MEEPISQDGRKRRSIFGPPSERNDKRARTCFHGEDCELITRVIAQESAIRNLATVVEGLVGRLAVLEGQPSITDSRDHPRVDTSKRQSCPARNCTKAFERIDHLHRHIRGVDDELHRSLTRALDQTYCIQCEKDFKRPCDLVRHEKSFHNEIYISRSYKFASHPAGFTEAPTPPDTSSNASADWDDPASESKQEDIKVSETIQTTAENGSNICSDLPQYISFAPGQPLEFSAYFNAGPSDFPGFSSDDIVGSDQIRLILPKVPTFSSVFFEGTPFDSESYPYLDNDSSNQAGLSHGFLPFFDGVPEDLSSIFT